MQMSIIGEGSGSWVSYHGQINLWVADPPSSHSQSSAVSARADQQAAHTRLSTLITALIGLACIAALAMVYFKFFYKYCITCDAAALERSRSRVEYVRRARADRGGNAVRAGVNGEAGDQAGGYGRPPGLAFSLIKLLPAFEWDYERICPVRAGAEDDHERECSICLTSFVPKDQVRLLPSCSHLFHLPCIDPWLLSHASCPLCRRGIFLLDAPSSLVHVRAPPLPYTRDFSIVPISPGP